MHASTAAGTASPHVVASSRLPRKYPLMCLLLGGSPRTQPYLLEPNVYRAQSLQQSENIRTTYPREQCRNKRKQDYTHLLY